MDMAGKNMRFVADVRSRLGEKDPLVIVQRSILVG